jgi:tRNA modification GTPase
MNHFSEWQDTIVALATPPGVGAIGVIRLSGEDAISIAGKLFKGKRLEDQPSHTVHFGTIRSTDDASGQKGEALDEVLITLFRAPHSYTGENVVEISCHGSPYVQQRIIEACTAGGARLAKPGEFTQRAFLNGKMDLAQAEAVADLIAANTRAAQATAFRQLRGGFSGDLKQLREELIHFAALMELELDFSDEDVEFADRAQFRELIVRLKAQVNKLIDSFSLGNAIRHGVSVAIIGKPNAGKSTLLNALLNEERAIVSEIAGTTRDTIEETLVIDGVLFRLIDTAGIREHSTDTIENLGIERSRQNAEKANIILHLVDLTDEEENNFEWLKQYAGKTVQVFNKTDLVSADNELAGNPFAIGLSAKNKTGIEDLKKLIFRKAIGESIDTGNTLVTNARHLEALQKTARSLEAVEEGMMSRLTGDLLTIDIRRALHYLGEITGQVEVDRDILGTIFGKFCIGK